MKSLMVKVIKGNGDSFTHLYFEPTAAAQCCLAFVVSAPPLPNMQEVQHSLRYSRTQLLMKAVKLRAKFVILSGDLLRFAFFGPNKDLNMGSLDKQREKLSLEIAL